MKQIILKTIMAIVTCFAITLQVGATNLRGQIVHNDAGVMHAMRGVRVDLMIWNGTKWVDMAFAITDGSGFYYFVNYDPNKQFFISVSGKYYPPQPIIIQDIRPPQYQDIPTIIN